MQKRRSAREASDGDVFLGTMGMADLSEERVRVLADKVNDALSGNSMAEGLLALCFNLHSFIISAPVDCRAGILAGIIRLIDPAKGNG